MNASLFSLLGRLNKAKAALLVGVAFAVALVGFTTLARAGENDCFPRSTLPCSQVKVTLPFELGFDAGAGGLADKNGAGTGFTVVDPPSARLTAPKPSRRPSATGSGGGAAPSR